MQFPEQPVFLLGEEKDYTIWLAHSTDPGDYGDGCILGYKEQYLRLRKSSVCQNGRDYVVTKQPSVCPCSLEDFLWYQHPSDPYQPFPVLEEAKDSSKIFKSFSFPSSSRVEYGCFLLRKLRHRERGPELLIIGQITLYQLLIGQNQQQPLDILTWQWWEGERYIRRMRIKKERERR